MYTTNFLEVLNLNIILFIAVTTTIALALGFIIVPHFEKNNSKRGVMIQGMFRGKWSLHWIAGNDCFDGNQSCRIDGIGAGNNSSFYIMYIR